MDRMKREDKDILKDPKLKENPFTVPEGYFSDFKGKASVNQAHWLSPRQNHGGRYIAIAASFALLLGIGLASIKGLRSSDEYNELDLMVLSDISAESYYDLLSYDNEELTEDDIIAYLIDSGQDINDLEPNE